MKNGGAGVYVVYPEIGNESTCSPTGTFCSNYSAEVRALSIAAEIIKNTTSQCQQVVFLTDAMSVLQALESNKLPELKEALREVSITRKVVLQWIPSHCGIPRNERADILAKEGATQEQKEQPITYQEQKTLIKAIRKIDQPKDNYHYLDRAKQVILFRARTGHNRLNSHLHRLRLVPSPLCPCGQAAQTAEHILQNCNILNQLRTEHWPTVMNIHQKLYGSLDELINTATYIQRTGLLV